MKKFIISAVCLAVVAACSDSATEHEEKIAKTEMAIEKVANKVADKVIKKVADKMPKSGIDKQHFDHSVRPQDDLFQHVNGKWLNEFEIPADKSNYGSFTLLAEKAKEDVKAIIEDSSKLNAEKGSDAQKVGDLYKSYMNTELLEDLGTKPISSEFTKIDAISNLAELSSYIAYAQMISSAPIGVFVYADPKDPTQYITQMGQGGLGLPSRETYIDDDEKSAKTRAQYVEHMTKMFELAGVKDAASKANTVMKIETELAQKQWAKEVLRDPQKTYNKMSVAELQTLMPNMDWAAWKKAAFVDSMDAAIVGQPDYFTAVSDMMESVSLDDWKTYYKWHMLTDASSFLNEELDDENFNFYQGILSGVKEQEPRWKRGVGIINGVLGEVVGKIYVQKHFKPEAKAKMTELVENLRRAYGEGIQGLEWMGEETKKQAMDKLAKFDPKIGYPDKWKDYSALDIDANDLAGNMRRATMVAVKQNREKLGQPIDRSQWFMNPQTVNAYYNPVMNEIVFPAAILQPPFFNLEADDAVNYGGIGAVIGHEMGHGFDDSGSQFDGDGKLRDWWTKDDRSEFESRAGKLVAQYNDFTVLDGTHVNGEFTQGENIGDLSGLTIAFKAYQLSKDGIEAPIIEGMSGDQRVFYGWSQVWRRKYRDAELAKRIKTDPHSPAEFRANGTVMNMPEFHQAFDVKPGDKMYTAPEKRVKIW